MKSVHQYCALVFSALGLTVDEAHSKTVSESLMSAQFYQGQSLTGDYWISEKLDGIRAIWDGNQLMTRTGHRLHAPESFIKAMPDFAVEGELWAGRGNFAQVQRTVLDAVPDETSWRTITFVIFDQLNNPHPYSIRYQSLINWHHSLKDAGQIKIIEQMAYISQEQLEKQLNAVTSLGGEGLMLRSASAVYTPGRTEQMLKYKHHSDAEAVVIGYKAGKGKYAGLVGALHVESLSGKRFYIGSGLSDFLRENPPAIGSMITYRFNGTTSNGLPRFPRYLRQRLLP